LDHYKLTSSYLVVRRTDETMICCIPLGWTPCGKVTQSQNTMDLLQIMDVDSSAIEAGSCCCASGHDEVHVKMRQEMRQSTASAGHDHDEPSGGMFRGGGHGHGHGPADDNDDEVLKVEPRMGGEIMAMILNAIEENQMHVAGGDMSLAH